PEREPLLAFAEQHEIGHRLHIPGQREDIPALQAAADILVMPSLWEGLPLALLEAMVEGKACIASRTSGIPEAITHGVQGLLVPPGDVAALAAALHALILDPVQRAALGNAAREHARREFSVQAMADRYETLLAE